MTKDIVKFDTSKTPMIKGDMFFDPAIFEHAQRVAKVFTQSSMVPAQFQGDKNIGNVMIAMNYAHRVEADIFMVLQNMYVIHGKPGIETKLAIALLNNSGRFTNLKYKYNDNKSECTAYATDLKSNELCEGVTVSLDMANKEGWASKQGSKWKTLPELMLMYRSAIFFIRAYAPDVLLGMRAKEELIDITPVRHTSVIKTDDLGAAIAKVPEEKPTSTDDLGAALKGNGQKKPSNDVPKQEKPPLTPEEEAGIEADKVMNEAETVPSAWLLASYKNMRAGQFDPSKTSDKWTGFARHVFDNRGTWKGIMQPYKVAAVKKWDSLYKGRPFMLDSDGDVVLTPPPPEQEKTEDTPDLSKVEPPSTEGTVSVEQIIDKRAQLAKAKVIFPEEFNGATDTLIGSGLIRHASIESMTFYECEAVNGEMTRIIEGSD